MKTFYMDVNNSWDAARNARDERAAVELLFPDASEIRYIGVDDYEGATALVFEVTDALEHFEIYVIERI